VKTGSAIPKYVGEQAHSLSDLATQTNDFLVESGIWKTVGSNTAKYAFGPGWGLAFNAAVDLMDLGIELRQGLQNEAEWHNAQQNLDVMRYQYSNAEEKLTNLKEDLSTRCGTTSTVKAVTPGSNVPAPTAPPKHGHTGLIVGGVVAAGGAGAAAYEVGKLAKNSSNNSSKQL